MMNMSEVIVNDMEGFFIIDGTKIYREELLAHLDWHLHNAGHVSKEQLQDLGKLIINDLLIQKQR